MEFFNRYLGKNPKTGKDIIEKVPIDQIEETPPEFLKGCENCNFSGEINESGEIAFCSCALGQHNKKNARNKSHFQDNKNWAP